MKPNKDGHIHQSVYDELLAALIDRRNGYQGRNARDVQADMERTIDEIKIVLECQK